MSGADLFRQSLAKWSVKHPIQGQSQSNNNQNEKISHHIGSGLLLFIGEGQVVPYQLGKTVSEGQSEVTFNVYVFCDSKKELNHAAYVAGIRCVMFEGIPGTRFSKPLLNEGEGTLIDKHPTYFEELYGWRYADYVKDCVLLSKFNKSGVGKSTLFEITVKAFELRKDLEKNKIKTKLGI